MADQRRLLTTPKLGPLVLERLDAIGIRSLDGLRSFGVDEAIERICAQVGNCAWRNRRAALLGLLASPALVGDPQLDESKEPGMSNPPRAWVTCSEETAP